MQTAKSSRMYGDNIGMVNGRIKNSHRKAAAGAR